MRCDVVILEETPHPPPPPPSITVDALLTEGRSSETNSPDKHVLAGDESPRSHGASSGMVVQLGTAAGLPIVKVVFVPLPPLPHNCYLARSLCSPNFITSLLLLALTLSYPRSNNSV
jgi:hypothetical protein